MPEPDNERKQTAQERVDAASEEAFMLALDAIFDSAIQDALLKRSQRTD